MKTKHDIDSRHLALSSSIAAFLVLCIALPYLPGRHFDGALTISLLAQLVGVAGIVLVPLGAVWLAYRRRRDKVWSAAPLYFLLVPGVALLAQIALAAPLTNRSRDLAVESSADMIRDIELFRARNGSYPVSLYAVWPDYLPGVVGIARYHYEPHGEGYNLAFEQPRLLLDDFGVREFVVFNPRDEQAMTSHAMWRLSQPGLRGWFAAGDAGAPHWKYFLFD